MNLICGFSACSELSGLYLRFSKPEFLTGKRYNKFYKRFGIQKRTRILKSCIAEYPVPYLFYISGRAEIRYFIVQFIAKSVIDKRIYIVMPQCTIPTVLNICLII